MPTLVGVVVVDLSFQPQPVRRAWLAPGMRQAAVAALALIIPGPPLVVLALAASSSSQNTQLSRKTVTPNIIDIYHGNIVNDFAALKAAGILGVIHKCTQGAGYADPLYAMRRKLATDAGLL